NSRGHTERRCTGQGDAGTVREAGTAGVRTVHVAHTLPARDVDAIARSLATPRSPHTCSGSTRRHASGVVVCIASLAGTTIAHAPNAPAGHGHAVADGIAVAAAATVHEVVDGSCRYIDAVVGSGTNSAVTADDTLMHRTAGHDYGVVLGAA